MSIPLESTLRYHTTSVDADYPDSRTNLRAESDSGLVSLVKRGEHDAFEELVRRYRNDVFALSYHYLRNREEAWDISQEVFIKAHRAIGRFRGEASFKTWVLRITANRCKDFFKKRRLKTVPLDDPVTDTQQGSETDTPGRALEAKELGEAIQQALDTLSDKHRTAFILREYEDLSYEHMAEVMKCSIGTVMSRLHHARKKMQKALINMGVVEEPEHA